MRSILAKILYALYFCIALPAFTFVLMCNIVHVIGDTIADIFDAIELQIHRFENKNKKIVKFTESSDRRFG